jgi:acyl-CoA thioester hydrolase
MWFGKLGGSSVEVCYEVHNDPAAEPRTIYARSTAIIVLVDAKSGRPTRLTQEMRDAWEPYVGPSIEYTHR